MFNNYLAIVRYAYLALIFRFTPTIIIIIMIKYAPRKIKLPIRCPSFGPVYIAKNNTLIKSTTARLSKSIVASCFFTISMLSFFLSNPAMMEKSLQQTPQKVSGAQVIPAKELQNKKNIGNNGTLGKSGK